MLQEGGEQQGSVRVPKVSSLQLLDLQQPVIRSSRVPVAADAPVGFLPAGAPSEATPVFDLGRRVLFAGPSHPHYQAGEEMRPSVLVERRTTFQKHLRWPPYWKRSDIERLLGAPYHVPGLVVQGMENLEAVWGESLSAGALAEAGTRSEAGTRPPRPR